VEAAGDTSAKTFCLDGTINLQLAMFSGVGFGRRPFAVSEQPSTKAQTLSFRLS
jgi:hypothetical protein